MELKEKVNNSSLMKHHEREQGKIRCPARGEEQQAAGGGGAGIREGAGGGSG